MRTVRKSQISRFTSEFHAEGTDRFNFGCDLMDQRFGDQFVHPHDRQGLITGRIM